MATETTMVYGLYAFVALLDLYGLSVLVNHITERRAFRNHSVVAVPTVTMLAVTAIIVAIYILGIVMQTAITSLQM